MTWEVIGGWFDYSDLYDAAVDRAPNDRPSVFVEVGSYLGRSAAYLGQAIQASGKPILLHCVDCWDGTVPLCDELEKSFQQMERDGKSVYNHFVDNIAACGLSSVVHPIRTLSTVGAQQFADQSCDFVFIDADHSKEAVLADIRAWLPKVRPGGIIAGHDYNRDSVFEPVHELLGKPNIRTSQNECSWIYEVPNG